MDKKNSQTALLNQVLIQFDIQTKVRKIAIQSFEKLLLSNKQAFQFIQQSQKKLIDFQTRICKAQNQYNLISNSCNQKMKITQELKIQLAQFKSDFWAKLQQGTDQDIRLKNKLNQAMTQLKKNGTAIAQQDKQLERLDQVTLNLDKKIQSQVLKLLQQISTQTHRTNQQLNQKKKSIDNIMKQVSQSKALLDSKSAFITQLLKDVQLYKYQKQSINSRINNLYQQIPQRVLKNQLYQMRKYFDGIIQDQKLLVNQNFTKINQTINKNKIIHQKKDYQIIQSIKMIEKYFQKQDKILFEKIQKNDIQFKQDIKIIKQKINKNFQQLKLQIQTDKTNIIKINQNLQQNKIKLLKIDGDLQQKNDRIIQMQSNILSVNQGLSMIRKQIQDRKNQLKKLQQSNQSNGDLSTKLQTIIQQIKQLKQSIIKNQQIIQFNNKNIIEENFHIKQNISKLQNQFRSINLKFQQNFTNLQYNINNFQKEIKNIIENNKNIARQYTDRIISSIGNQLDNLNKVSQQVNQFKQLFKKQMKQSDETSHIIGQKIQRMFSMFTKLKSDFTIKIDSLSQDLIKKSGMIKQSQKIIDQIRLYLSEVNQMINISLSTAIWRDCLQGQTYKISSIIQGWILEIDDKQKVRYRGQNINRAKLLEIALDSFVKLGDKIKGQTIHPGKDIFSRLLDNNTELTIRSKKRAVSRRRQSQLPKVYK